MADGGAGEKKTGTYMKLTEPQTTFMLDLAKAACVGGGVGGAGRWRSSLVRKDYLNALGTGATFRQPPLGFGSSFICRSYIPSSLWSDNLSAGSMAAPGAQLQSKSSSVRDPAKSAVPVRACAAR